MLEVTLPSGVTIAATGVDVAAALAVVVTPTVMPSPAQPSPTVEAPTSTTQTERKSRKPSKRTSEPNRKQANQAAQKRITELRKAGDHDGADAIARERGWSVPTRKTTTSKPEPKSEPTTVAPTVRTDAKQAKPASKRDRSAGGTRRTNGHKLDCACAMCVKLFPAVTQPVTADAVNAREPQSRLRDRKPTTQSDKLHTPHVRTSDEAAVATLRAAEKSDALRRHHVLDACAEVRDDIRERVTAAVRADDPDTVDAIVGDLSAQMGEHHDRIGKCDAVGDGIGAWEAHELTKALTKAYNYAESTLAEMLA